MYVAAGPLMNGNICGAVTGKLRGCGSQYKQGLDREDCERRKNAAKTNTTEEPRLLPSSRKDIWGIQNEEAVWTSAGIRTWMGLKTECKQMKTKGVRTYGEMAQPRSHFVKERLINWVGQDELTSHVSVQRQENS
ncbi:hypothetical protein DFH08DRAFT_817467 [Mycena albidolilacea]|uniref:Uncharacterized protein n=1 Tax=Mycena albidolilacea TaxID=1033008 RepID=A0AAD7EHQ3_9AGAR|nr:hypothetical protein DFH08DRAFT_817467 [Mycena albidolilacea]